MVTYPIFLILILLVGLQRLIELRISKRNEALILSKGGREHPSKHFSYMKLLHALWLPAAFAEAIIFQRPFIPLLAFGAVVLFLVGQSLRYAAIRALGWRWTVNIMTLPRETPVNEGIYSFIRHPNYLGVVLEIFALPLFHTAYLTAIFFSFLNAFVLYLRITSEEKALIEDSRYERIFMNLPRFIPHFTRKISKKEGAD
jgi:methyltransferase